MSNQPDGGGRDDDELDLDFLPNLGAPDKSRDTKTDALFADLPEDGPIIEETDALDEHVRRLQQSTQAWQTTMSGLSDAQIAVRGPKPVFAGMAAGPQGGATSSASQQAAGGGGTAGGGGFYSRMDHMKKFGGKMLDSLGLRSPERKK